MPAGKRKLSRSRSRSGNSPAAKYCRCVSAVKRKSPSVNPYAVCHTSVRGVVGNPKCGRRRRASKSKSKSKSPRRKTPAKAKSPRRKSPARSGTPTTWKAYLARQWRLEQVEAQLQGRKPRYSVARHKASQGWVVDNPATGPAAARRLRAQGK